MPHRPSRGIYSHVGNYLSTHVGTTRSGRRAADHRPLTPPVTVCAGDGSTLALASPEFQLQSDIKYMFTVNRWNRTRLLARKSWPTGPGNDGYVCRLGWSPWGGAVIRWPTIEPGRDGERGGGVCTPTTVRRDVTSQVRGGVGGSIRSGVTRVPGTSVAPVTLDSLARRQNGLIARRRREKIT